MGAPYENNYNGVVYIYCGTATGVNPKPCQRIRGDDIVPMIRGFGVSISRAIDIDANGYVDVMIGAHQSGHAILLRTRPVCTISHRIALLTLSLSVKETEFRIRTCYNINAVPTLTEYEASEYFIFF